MKCLNRCIYKSSLKTFVWHWTKYSDSIVLSEAQDSANVTETGGSSPESRRRAASVEEDRDVRKIVRVL